MDADSFVEINKEIFRTCLDGFAKPGFSGDLEFRYGARQIYRTALDIHVLDSQAPCDPVTALASVEKNWPRLTEWVNHNDETLLRVRFQHGRITRVDVRNRTQRWELVPESD